MPLGVDNGAEGSPRPCRSSQSQAAQVFGLTQPCVPDLKRGKIDLFGVDTLVNMAAAAGLQMEIRVLEAA